MFFTLFALLTVLALYQKVLFRGWFYCSKMELFCCILADWKVFVMVHVTTEAVLHCENPCRCVYAISKAHQWCTSEADGGLSPSCDMRSHRSPTPWQIVLVSAVFASCVCWCSPPSLSCKYKRSCGLILYVRDSWNIFWSWNQNWHILMSGSPARVTATCISQSTVKCIIGYRPASLGGRCNQLM